MRSTGLELTGAWNFRDVAEDSGIRPGRFFRSSELTRLDDAGRAAILARGVSDVADLRSDHEVERRGTDQVPDKVAVHRLPFRELGAQAPHEQVFERMLSQRIGGGGEAVGAAALRYMTEQYAKYPGMPGAQAAARRVISTLAEGYPLLVHCFAGKDRTGFIVALVLNAVGVDRDAIMKDYLRSNDAVPRLRVSILDSVQERDGERSTDEIITFAEARLADEVLGAREDYLISAFNAIDAEYGSTSRYFDAIGVPPNELRRLRTHLR